MKCIEEGERQEGRKAGGKRVCESKGQRVPYLCNILRPV